MSRNERAALLFSRSVKGDAQERRLATLLGCLDLTSLEGTDTPSRIRELANRALRPDTNRTPVAAVCVYPARVRDAVEVLAGTTVKVAAVAGAFPSGLSLTEVVIADVAATARSGADEIDIVIDRSLMLSGRVSEARSLLSAQIEAAEGLPVKVILESGELGSLEMIAQATRTCIESGASFVKTSTGKIGVGATPAAVLTMALELRDHYERSGVRIGLKVSGGVRLSKDAIGYSNIVLETLGDEWLKPDLFRIGASTLLDDICLQMRFHETGSYPSDLYLPK